MDSFGRFVAADTKLRKPQSRSGRDGEDNAHILTGIELLSSKSWPAASLTELCWHCRDPMLATELRFAQHFILIVTCVCI
jgi:hypothetical protein